MVGTGLQVQMENLRSGREREDDGIEVVGFCKGSVQVLSLYLFPSFHLVLLGWFSLLSISVQ